MELRSQILVAAAARLSVLAIELLIVGACFKRPSDYLKYLIKHKRASQVLQLVKRWRRTSYLRILAQQRRMEKAVCDNLRKTFNDTPKISGENVDRYDKTCSIYERRAIFYKSTISEVQAISYLDQVIDKNLGRRWQELGDTEKAKLTTLADVKKFLKGRLSPEGDARMLRLAYGLRQQRDDETLYSYYDELRRKFILAGYEWTESRKAAFELKFIEGLRPDFKREAIKGKNLEEVLEFAKREEQFALMARGQFNKLTSSASATTVPPLLATPAVPAPTVTTVLEGQMK